LRRRQLNEKTETIRVTLRLDISKDRAQQQKDKTKSQLQARIIEDTIFDKFKMLRDGLHEVPCPEHAITGTSTTFHSGRNVKLSDGQRRETVIDYTIHGCCCEKIADAAIEKFKYYQLERLPEGDG